MTRSLIAVVALLALITAAHAFGLGLGNRFGRLGAMNGGTASVAPVGCASPTAPNGVVDLSQCSNSYYVAVILF